MFKQKLKAGGIHLFLSLIVISFFIGLILLFWFPNSLVKVSNFKEIALLIISIDLILGPLLTFVIFKPKKKGLKFDLSAIATLQASALAYGLFTLYQAHPVYITFNIDRFTLVKAIDAQPEKAQYTSLKVSKFSTPKFVVAKLPESEKERSELLLKVATQGEADIELRPEYYHPYEDNISDILVRSLDPNVIFKSPDATKKLEKFIKQHGKSKNDYAYLPLEGSVRDVIWVLDKKSAKPIDIISVNPWVTASTKLK